MNIKTKKIGELLRGLTIDEAREIIDNVEWYLLNLDRYKQLIKID